MSQVRPIPSIPDEGYTFDVIIPVYGATDMTIACLESIRVAMGENRFRVIIVDNASDGQDSDRLYDWMDARRQSIPFAYIENSVNLGFVKATNMGLARSTARYVVFQNNDTIASPGLYDRLRSVCDLPSCGVVGPVSSSGWQNFTELSSRWDELKTKVPTGHTQRAALLRRLNPGKHREVSTMVAFFCAMIRREVVQKVGYLSEEYRLGFGDDDDYCERIRQAGFKVCVALDAYCEHHHRTTWKALYSATEIEAMQKTAMAHYRSKWGKGVR